MADKANILSVNPVKKTGPIFLLLFFLDGKSQI